MKKTILILFSTLILLMLTAYLILVFFNYNRFGTDHYFVQIKGEGIEIIEKDPAYNRFEYTLPAYDDKGNEETFTFTAPKQLRQEAYLKLFVKTSGVSSYEEVQFNELPKEVQQLFEN